VKVHGKLVLLLPKENTKLVFSSVTGKFMEEDSKFAIPLVIN